jgi:hypothetical protein
MAGAGAILHHPAFGLPRGDFRDTLGAHTHQHDVTQAKKSTRRRRSRSKAKQTPARQATRPPEAPPSPPVPAPTAAIAESATAESAPFEVELAHPEVEFAARAAARPPEPERPFPSGRRAIFFDVENTSRPQHIARVIDYLVVDRQGRRTDFVAVGNWRVIGHDTARLLAGHGAQLLHSAPSVGVKDWSDLRIAVAAGVWLGTARPGDVLEVISDDRAFDAVGDVAVGLGIAFRRLSYRALTGMQREAEPLAISAPVEPRAEPSGGGGGRRRRGRRGGHGRREGPVLHPPPPPPPPPAPIQTEEAGPHTAPHDELLGIARELIGRSSSGAVTLDSLANALKSRGFSRPPGSPRLITRLRRLRELVVSRSGHITLVDGASAPPAEPQTEPGPSESPAAEAPAEADAEPPMPAVPAREPEPEADVEDDDNRGNRLGYDDRRRAVEAAQSSSRYIDSRALTPSSQGNRPGARPDARPNDGFRRRRSRRGGRRQRGAPAAG